jgi:hypothetical protein
MTRRAGNLRAMGGTDASHGDAIRRRELGNFLRARRVALQPQDVGLPDTERRRVTGLRRHEVADLAAVSLTWYTWLEQGRDIRTTGQVLDSLARALQLDEAGRRHARRLAGLPADEPKLVTAGYELDPNLIDLVNDQLPSPACIIRTTGDLVAWNQAFASLFIDPGTLPPARRNALIVMLTSPGIRATLRDWEAQSRDTIAAFRAEAGKNLGHPRFAQITELLLRESDLFRDSWPRQEIRRFIGHRQVLVHPQIGELHAQQLLLRPLGQPSFIVMIHRIADAGQRKRLAHLLDSPAASERPATAPVTGE